jgi:pimeloyl-ACP methyl ester carboxylesterase
MNYALLAKDIFQWIEARGIVRPHLVGHSMGGKAAMHFACSYPQALASLTIVDIAPKSYSPHHRAELEAMQALDLQNITSRRDAESALEATINDWALRQFILTNLVRTPSGNFTWQVNLPLILKSLPELSLNPLPAQACFNGPTLFIRGGKSNFMLDADIPQILQHFPNAEIKSLYEAGHNPHMDARDAFLASVRNFIG